MVLIMDHHFQAWGYISKELFGSVCEVTHKIPWGFIGKRDNFTNLSVEQFLTTKQYYGTILLHILSGEGIAVDKIIQCIDHAQKYCVKLILLEHNPEHSDWSNIKTRLANNLLLIEEKLNSINTTERISWGRNLLIKLSVIPKLNLDLNDQYYEENIRYRFTKKTDLGCDRTELIYTHTSEKPISNTILDELQHLDRITWVIGGMLALETIPKLVNIKHYLIDSVLLQAIYALYIIDPKDQRVQLLYDTNRLKRVRESAPIYMDQNTEKNWWRNIDKLYNLSNISKYIESIMHKNLKDFKDPGQGIYVSTVPRQFWQHLIGSHYIISSVENPMDFPTLIKP